VAFRGEVGLQMLRDAGESDALSGEPADALKGEDGVCVVAE
jgi:hypothetical protein